MRDLTVSETFEHKRQSGTKEVRLMWRDWINFSLQVKVRLLSGRSRSRELTGSGCKTGAPMLAVD